MAPLVNLSLTNPCNFPFTFFPYNTEYYYFLSVFFFYTLLWLFLLVTELISDESTEERL